MEYKTSMDILIYCTFNILVSLLQSGFMWYHPPCEESLVWIKAKIKSSIVDTALGLFF